jgi:carbamoyltransferase
MYILGLLFGGRNPSACLLKDNEILAIVEEERFTRKKQANLDFPIHSIRYCLDFASIKLTNLDSVAVGWDSSKFHNS